MDLQTLKNHIYTLENRLLQPEVRQSKEKMREVLSDDCFEFCSSGKVWIFSEDDFQADHKGLYELHWEIRDFKIRLLAVDVVLSTFSLVKHDEPREEFKYSLRSSIWQCINNQWKMIFHQGTLTGKDNVK